jgi:putative copper resistance protein D
LTDFIAIGLRALEFAAVLQAAGVPLFQWLFGGSLEHTGRPIGLLAVSTAAAGLVLTLGHALIEPARLAGELRGIFDASLQGLLLASDAGATAGVRVLGLAMVAGGSLKPSRLGTLVASMGATLIVVSFAFMGHTATDHQRWLLAPLLILHLTTISFWFGGLWPLLLATRHESAAVAGTIIEQFSRLAIWLVPVIFLAGVAMASLLLPGLASLRTPYGLSLLSKVATFALLMGLAAANKWRLGPKVANGDQGAIRTFQRSIEAEWSLILAVVAITATMTALFSPEH